MYATISVKQKFEAEFNELFNNTDSSQIPIVESGYHSVDEILTNSLLFVGLNPSNTAEIKSNFYHLSQSGNKYQKYWKVFETLGEETSLPWSHLDLLVLRCTNQSGVKELLNSEVGLQFLHRQVMISKQILLLVQPRIIVVTNSLSKEFLGKNQKDGKGIWMGYNFSFDEEIGTDRIISNDILNGTPVFFTSMLSGQRALDLGSKDRLVWHIKKVNSLLLNHN